MGAKLNVLCPLIAFALLSELAFCQNVRPAWQRFQNGQIATPNVRQQQVQEITRTASVVNVNEEDFGNEDSDEVEFEMPDDEINAFFDELFDESDFANFETPTLDMDSDSIKVRTASGDINLGTDGSVDLSDIAHNARLEQELLINGPFKKSNIRNEILENTQRQNKDVNQQRPQWFQNLVQPRVNQNPTQSRVNQNPTQSRVNQNSIQQRVNQNTIIQPRVNQNTIQPRVNRIGIQPRVNQNTIQPRVNQNAIQPRVNQNTIQPRVNQIRILPRVNQNPIQSSSNVTNRQRSRMSWLNSQMKSLPSKIFRQFQNISGMELFPENQLSTRTKNTVDNRGTRRNQKEAILQGPNTSIVSSQVISSNNQNGNRHISRTRIHNSSRNSTRTISSVNNVANNAQQIQQSPLQQTRVQNRNSANVGTQTSRNSPRVNEIRNSLQNLLTGSISEPTQTNSAGPQPNTVTNNIERGISTPQFTGNQINLQRTSSPSIPSSNGNRQIFFSSNPRNIQGSSIVNSESNVGRSSGQRPNRQSILPLNSHSLPVFLGSERSPVLQETVSQPVFLANQRQRARQFLQTPNRLNNRLQTNQRGTGQIRSNPSQSNTGVSMPITNSRRQFNTRANMQRINNRLQNNIAANGQTLRGRSNPSINNIDSPGLTRQQQISLRAAQNRRLMRQRIQSQVAQRNQRTQRFREQMQQPRDFRQLSLNLFPPRPAQSSMGFGPTNDVWNPFFAQRNFQPSFPFERSMFM